MQFPSCSKDAGGRTVSVEEEFVFPELVNRCAFVDQVVFSLSGRMRRSTTGALYIVRNVAIGGSKSLYARAVDAKCSTTGNSVQVKYGKRGKIRDLLAAPHYRLLMRSEHRPITAAESMQTLGGFMRRGASVQVGMVELTFDLTGISVEELKVSCLTHFSRRVITDGEGRMTFYVGSVKSIWSARFYEKTPLVTRVEFVLRSPFLRQYGISTAPDLLRLRRIPIIDLLRLRAFPKGKGDWEERALEILTRDSEGMEIMLRDALQQAPKTLVEHPLCQVLRRMQGMLIW